MCIRDRPGTGAVFVVPMAGGAPRRVGANFTDARSPIWSKDGKHLLMIGYASAKAYDDASLDWWLVAINGDGAVRTGAYKLLAQDRLPLSTRMVWSSIPLVPAPASWSVIDN